MGLARLVHAMMLGAAAISALPHVDASGKALASTRHSKFAHRLRTLFPPGERAEGDNPPAVTYDTNWAGAVLTGAGYRTVTGTITVPAVRLPRGTNSNALHAVSAWVGIDGERACPHAILQAGVDMFMNHSSAVYWAWIEWSPNRTTYLPTVSIQQGDAITLNVTAPSLSSAIFTLHNGRTRTTTVARLAAAGPAPLLCGLSAEWIVEDFWASDGVPLADFGSIAFTAAQFATNTGITGGIEGARLDAVRETPGAAPVIECGKTGGEEVVCSFRQAARS